MTVCKASLNNFSEVFTSKTFGQCIHTNILSEVTIDVFVLLYSTSYFPSCDKTSKSTGTSHVAPLSNIDKISVLVDNHRLQTYRELESG